MRDAAGEVVVATVMESYCRYSEASLKFVSPVLERGRYTLTVTVLDQRFFWQAKDRAFGSEGDFVSVQRVLIEN